MYIVGSSLLHSRNHLATVRSAKPFTVTCTDEKHRSKPMYTTQNMNTIYCWHQICSTREKRTQSSKIGPAQSLNNRETTTQH
ncbi:hypothetical protein F511_18449 [Dorcoceras hygrometricum]|uniref:Uncharacterized protein n=1 Tax=Dorcoceras hygrometricum TaxID=472368 RepID=A0A2Z7A675_9LAMI|nr:hypothetical protein F511_18449 [Dorcoceras hygrometricum]